MNQRQFAIEIVKRLRERGFTALWAGGCVRDQLIGKEPKDYDVATNAHPSQIREVFGNKRTLAIGAAFGVITVLGPKSAGQIEVATFRTDQAYSDGRHPDSVEFSTAEEDAHRRDFTINGLFFDPLDNQVIDFVDGQQDLEKKIIRAIGDPFERIAEDKLRMLRAVRFSATFDFEIEENTFRAIRDCATEINIVSAERIGGELKRMLGHHNRHRAVAHLARTGLLEQILAPTPVPDNWTHKLQRAAERETETLRQLDRHADHSVALVALVRHACDDAKQVESVGRNIKWSNEEIAKSRWIYSNCDLLKQAESLPWSQVQPLLVNAWSRDALLLVQALGNDPGQLASVAFCLSKLQLPLEELDPPPLLNGDDLIQMGIQPGPQFKAILQSIRNAQLDRKISTPAEASATVNKLLEQ